MPAAVAVASLLVLDLLATGADPATTRAAQEEVLSAALAARPGAVTSIGTVRDVLDLEVKKQLTGCDDSSCAAQIAGALGARQVLAGSVISLEGQTLVQLRLIDVQEAKLVGRATAQARRARDLPEAVRKATFQILGARYVPGQRHEVDRRYEVALQGGYHYSPGRLTRGLGHGVQGMAHFAWRLRELFFVGPEVGYVTRNDEAIQRDLPGIEVQPDVLGPAALSGGVRGGVRRRVLDWLAVRGTLAVGGTVVFEPNLDAAPAVGAYVRPSAGVELPADQDFFGYVDLAYAVRFGAPEVQLKHLNPWGGYEGETVPLPLSGVELSVGVAYAF